MHVQIEKATVLAAKAGPQGMEDIDTDDEKDEEAQYELWKGREMARIRFVTPVACWCAMAIRTYLTITIEAG